MNLLEVFNQEMQGYRTEKDDNTTLSLDDLRKTKLTLAQINRLRIINDVRKLEKEHDIESIQNQYQSRSDSASTI
jgi:hypothetical protein